MENLLPRCTDLPFSDRKAGLRLLSKLLLAGAGVDELCRQNGKIVGHRRHETIGVGLFTRHQQMGYRAGDSSFGLR